MQTQKTFLNEWVKRIIIAGLMSIGGLHPIVTAATGGTELPIQQSVDNNTNELWNNATQVLGSSSIKTAVDAVKKVVRSTWEKTPESFKPYVSQDIQNFCETHADIIIKVVGGILAIITVWLVVKKVISTLFWPCCFAALAFWLYRLDQKVADQNKHHQNHPELLEVVPNHRTMAS
ncbi:MAG: hypothetical protein WBQ73_00725 [Candidatus Babeliales bacterium]